MVKIIKQEKIQKIQKFESGIEGVSTITKNSRIDNNDFTKSQIISY